MGWLTPLYGGGFWVAFRQLALVYYAAAFLLHCVVPRVMRVKSVQHGRRPRPGQALGEALYSLGPLMVKAGVWTVVEQLYKRGTTRMYAGWPPSAQELAYMLLTVVALDYLHDAWFYWTHRMLHWKPLYMAVHLPHHRSTVPTAFCGYSFHVAEALIVFANEILVCYLLPIHAGLHRCYHLYTTVIHEGGHAGYEIAPFIPTLEAVAAAALGARRRSAGSAPAAPCAALNTVRHHDMHHRYPRSHFSLYFTHWDRWCGTEHPGYRSAVASHFSGGDAGAARGGAAKAGARVTRAAAARAAAAGGGAAAAAS